jgi:hypothetical protein
MAYSIDNFASATDTTAKDGFLPNGATSPNDVFSMAIDSSTNPSTVYAGTGCRDTNTCGDVQYQVLPANSSKALGNWTTTGLFTAAGGKKALGLGLGKDSNGQTILVAMVLLSGVWRRQGNSTWTLVLPNSINCSSPINQNVQVVWPKGSKNVYFYDCLTGIYRSTDYGLTWSLLLPRGKLQGGNLIMDPSTLSYILGSF